MAQHAAGLNGRRMMSLPSLMLLAAAGALFVAALAHFACIAVGPRAYRLMGAGDSAARAAERGERGPHVAAFVVGSALLVVASYALSGAGWLPGLPLLRWVLGGVSLVLLARAFLFPLLRSYVPGNTDRFWWVSSTICLVLGGLLLFGAMPLWRVG